MVFETDYDEIMERLEQEDSQKIAEERDKRMTECFRRVFSTDDGKRVLHQLLLDLEFFNCQINSPQEIALNNYAKFMIFKRLGCNNDKQISDAIFNCNKK